MYTVHLTFDQPPVESMLDYMRSGTVVYSPKKAVNMYSRDSVSQKSRFATTGLTEPSKPYQASGSHKLDVLAAHRRPFVIPDAFRMVQNTSQLMKETNRSGDVKRMGCT
jgi:hypothetical protein